jgi:hypothetical protein
MKTFVVENPITLSGMSRDLELCVHAVVELPNHKGWTQLIKIMIFVA